MEVVVSYLTSRANANILFAVGTAPTNGVLGFLNPFAGRVAYTPSTNYFGQDQFTFTVNSGGSISTGVVSITVSPVNDAPVFLTPLLEASATEQVMFTVTNAATDVDLPQQTLTYQLLVGPDGASVNGQGVVAWLPGEEQGGTSNVFTVVVSDGELGTTNSLVVSVSESNEAPTLGPLADLTVEVGAALVVTNVAADSDLPAQALTFELLGPDGSAIDNSGVITWTPDTSHGGTTNPITTVVSDGQASATNRFQVIVLPPLVPPVILSLVAVEGQVTVTWSAAVGQIYDLQHAEDLALMNWVSVASSMLATNSFMDCVVAEPDAPMMFYRVKARRALP
jgi:hypothetical protein